MGHGMPTIAGHGARSKSVQPSFFSGFEEELSSTYGLPVQRRHQYCDGEADVCCVDVAYLSRKVSNRIFRERQDVKREAQPIPLVLDHVLECWPGRRTLRTRQINEDVDLGSKQQKKPKHSRSTVRY